MKRPIEAERTSRSGWSLQIGSALGIPIRVHFTFFLLLIWFGLVSARSGNDLVLALVFLGLVFGCVILHELGHAAMARRFGVRTQEIVLYPIGGVARLENIPLGKAELLIALAGPAVNLLLALVVGLLILFTPWTLTLTPRLQEPSDLVGALLTINLALFLFNLLPAFPMDGGRVLRSALSLAMSQEQATQIATTIGQAVAILFGLAGVLSQNVLLMIIALFVFIGASQESFVYRQRAAVVGKTAGSAMITRFETLAPNDSLGTAAEYLVATHQQDFPVLDAWKRLVGVLPRARLLEGLARLGASAPVLEVMDRSVPTVSPDDDLQQVLDRLRASPNSPVIVLQQDRLLGMITLENLIEYIEVSRRTPG